MSDAFSFLPTSFNPVEEEVFGKAYCKTCDLKHFDDARAWAHQHVRETGHAVELHFGYDVRDEHWLSRLPYERLAELEALRADPKAASALAAKLLKDSDKA
ncbi:hypothetical protein [Caulobacter endophyticus]|uniref:Uncharacterized protein n=1 Tax=Caulobacter endophyticus TaxID=2172652 RepID=A0A2T9KCD5_9CAUL|nr:hypothetical protein [Caulobacter endophyticus]PVM93625.1 hypothetical protein DDF67_02740 [Caulobacter endophyticus]